MTFPFRRRRAPSALSSPIADDAKTVLIVEDNTLNMKLFQEVLQGQGHSTLQATNGAEAMELAREHQPDLIVMDIQLPWVSGRELSGLEVTKSLKDDEALRAIPVIVVTAFALKEEEEKIRESGCEDYLFKPISVPQFQQRVQSYLN